MTEKRFSQDIFSKAYSSSSKVEGSSFGAIPLDKDGKSDTSSSVGNGTRWVNGHCRCDTGYVAWGGACVLECDKNTETRDSTGVCQCKSGYERVNELCVENTSSVSE